jgi:hypothetical protein
VLRLRQSLRTRLNEIMKLDAFRTILAAAEKLYRGGGDDGAAQALDLLARLVAGRGPMTVAAFATRLSGIPVSAASDTPAGGPTVAGLQATLRSMLEFCEAAGAKTAAKDIRALADSLEAHVAESLNVFCAQADAWLAAPKPKGRGKGAAKKSAALNEAAIMSYLESLHAAGTDRTAFEAALARLKADKSVKSPEVAEIARRYANTVTKYKSMAAAHADIASAFTQQARFANKVG